MLHRLDVVDAASRESTRLVREPRQFHDSVVPAQAREPQLLGRFRQRLAEYKRFWVDVQAVSRATLQNSPRGAAVE